MERAGALVAIVNDGFALNAVTVILLDNGGSLTRLTLLDHGALPHPIPVAIAVALANGDTSANRANLNANILCRSVLKTRISAPSPPRPARGRFPSHATLSYRHT
jgi:hypothetical protein